MELALFNFSHDFFNFAKPKQVTLFQINNLFCIEINTITSYKSNNSIKGNLPRTFYIKNIVDH